MEKGQASLELSSLIVGIAAIAVALGVALGGGSAGNSSHASRIADRVESALQAAIAGSPSTRRVKVQGSRGARTGDRLQGTVVPRRSVPHGVPQWQYAGDVWQSRRYAAQGDIQVATWPRARTSVSGSASASAGWCALCARFDATGGVGLGRSGRRSPTTHGVHADALVAVSLVELWSTGRYSAHIGSMRVQGSGEVRAAAGADIRGSIVAQASPQRQRLDVEAGAMAGATARAEKRIAVRAAGIAVAARAGAEGWAGAGATGRITVDHHNGRFTFGSRLGAAWGLGGAADGTITFDVSGLRAWFERFAAGTHRESSARTKDRG